MLPTRSATLLATLVLATGAYAQSAPTPAPLRTRPERTGYRETSSYADVMDFVRRASAIAPRLLHPTTFGYTMEGRALPLVVVGRVRDASPAAVRASGKIRVYIQANIHAGEVEGKEATLMLLRALASGEHAAWFDSLVLLVAPIYNADGNERVKLTNRPLQYGPVGGMGQRPNAQELDLNRDHMKLESPEARSVVALFSSYDPQVAVDLHTTDGSVHGYHLTYSPPLHPNTDSAIVRLLKNDWLPAVTRAIKRRDGWDFYYYGNFPSPREKGAERGWYSFDARPRFNNNYIGLRNRIAILSEAYSYATFEERIRATYRFVEEILTYARAHAATVRRVVAAADSADVTGRTLAVREDFQRTDSVAILVGAVAEDRNPYTGERMWRRLEVRQPERMPEFQTFRPTETAVAPAFYYVPPGLTKVIALLDAHGVRLERLPRSAARTVERFTIDSQATATNEFQGHHERTLYGHWEAADVTLPDSTVVVTVRQPLGRLAFTLLEPRSDDGVVDWNVLDDVLEGARSYPILRGK
ncbi:MAG TPA: M14 family metallopeptidase [Gemmatimonadales bacterium]|nr:M14 family metallopeptidase [Gemmatimonadales bacterium]